MSEFKILSLNCRGLHDVNKRKDVFKYLREQKASLYCLQDTHCTENDKSVVYAQWGLDFLMSPGNSNSRGTLTLTNNNFEYTVLNVKSDPNGNYIVSSILVDNKYSLTIVNLYGQVAVQTCFGEMYLMLYLNLGKLLKQKCLNLLFSQSGIMKILKLTTIFFFMNAWLKKVFCMYMIFLVLMVKYCNMKIFVINLMY